MDARTLGFMVEMILGKGWVGGEKGGGGSPCWSATEQTVSIRLCSEVTNWESPQIQAKSEILHPVAEMPASTADD